MVVIEKPASNTEITRFLTDYEYKLNLIPDIILNTCVIYYDRTTASTSNTSSAIATPFKVVFKLIVAARGGAISIAAVLVAS